MARGGLRERGLTESVLEFELRHSSRERGAAEYHPDGVGGRLAARAAPQVCQVAVRSAIRASWTAFLFEIRSG